MERIYKKVSLESLRNRISNGMYYVPYDKPYDGLERGDSYGNFLVDLSEDKQYRTNNLLVKYYCMLQQIRDGIKLKNKSDIRLCDSSTRSNVFVEDTDYDCYLPNDDCDTIQVFNYGVFSIDDFTIDVEEYIPSNEIIPSASSYDRVVLIDDIETFNTYGGVEFLNNTYRNIIIGSGNGYIPYFEIPIALTQDIDDIGVMTDYEEEGILDERIASGFSYGDVDNPVGVSWDTIGMDVKNPLEPRYSAFTDYNTESKLKSVRVREVFTDDEGKVLPGLFKKRVTSSGQGMLVYRIRCVNGQIVETSEQTIRSYECCDGMSNEQCVSQSPSSTPHKYRTATILETAKKTIEKNPSNGYYFFLVKYDNSSSIPMDIPYKTLSDKYVLNKDSYEDTHYGDFILSIQTATTENTTKITFVYVLGGEYEIQSNGSYTYVPNTGIKYEETYVYNTGMSETITLDDCENVEIFYNEIDYELSQETIYNSDLMLYRSGNTAMVSAYTTGDVWRDGEAINAPVFKEEYLMGFNEGIKSEINVEINRGNAAAFERHLKLSECNSFSDLQNYGNNYYNL